MPRPVPELHLASDAAAAANGAAALIAEALRARLRAAPSASVAFSGGSTPAAMLDTLAAEALDWPRVHVFQVDERIAPRGSGERNLTGLVAHLVEPLQRRRLAPALHAIDVDRVIAGGDPHLAAQAYAGLLAGHAGGRLDVIHLGVGDDGHTASLVPGDPLLDEQHAAVGISTRYKGTVRFSLTFPTLAACHRLVWLAPGAAKRDAVARLLAGDPTIPAGRVAHPDAHLCCDAAAVGG